MASLARSVSSPALRVERRAHRGPGQRAAAPGDEAPPTTTSYHDSAYSPGHRSAGSNWAVDNSCGDDAKVNVSRLFRRVTQLFKSGVITYTQRQVIKGFVVSGRFDEARAILDDWKKARARSKIDRVTGHSYEDRAAVNSHTKKLTKAARVLGIDNPMVMAHGSVNSRISSQAAEPANMRRRHGLMRSKSFDQGHRRKKRGIGTQQQSKTDQVGCAERILSRSASMRQMIVNSVGNKTNNSNANAWSRNSGVRSRCLGGSTQSFRVTKSGTFSPSGKRHHANTKVSKTDPSILKSKSSHTQIAHTGVPALPVPSSSAAKMAKLTGYSPEDLSIEHDYRKALKVLGVRLEDVDLRSEMHLPKGKAVQSKSSNKIDRMTGTTAAYRRQVDNSRYNPKDYERQAMETELLRQRAKIDRIMGFSAQSRSVVDAEAIVRSGEQQHDETMAQRKANAREREQADRTLGLKAQQNNAGVRVEIMYPDDELKGLPPEEYFTEFILAATLHTLHGALDILKDWKYRVLFDIFENQSAAKSQLQKEQQQQQQQQIRSAVCSGAGGESKLEKVERKAIVNQRRRYGG
eukprot:g780.t1